MTDHWLRILPVIDLQAGRVVRASAGERDQYRPIQSKICRSSDPLEVATAFREQFGFVEFYMADLDAITMGKQQTDLMRVLIEAGFQLIVDAGVQTAAGVAELLERGVDQVIIALETLTSLSALSEMCSTTNPEQLVFSLDLKAGQPVTSLTPWQNGRALEIAQAVIGAGFSRLILLDLSDVGTNQGISTFALARELKQNWPEVQLILGGGIRSRADLHAARRAGADVVLIASALHNGQLKKEDLLPYVR